ncbi:MAG TPA: TIR domain-containing protein, partial [Thermoanaerobaculia bacterium]|nr:TIR domain-containing protein [Thermoanaerobaculia bacterium]
MRNPVRRLLRGVHALAERLRYRYDIFISYARSDGSAYAEGLKRSLAELDFTCFLDRHDLPAGEGLTRALHEAIRRSARQVIVGTPRATDPERKYIALEVEEFHASGRKAIPIDIGGALAAVEWDALRGDDLVWIDESVEALQRGIPSLSVVESIRTAFEIKKRNAVLRLEIAFVFSLFIAGAAVAFTVNWRTTESLMEQRAQNDAQILQLDAAKLQNELQERNLAGATRASVAAADEAKKQRELAVRSIALAEERLVDMTAEQGRLELLRGRPLHALLYLRDAKARGRDDEALQFMTHVAMQALTPVLWGHDGEVTEMAWSPSGTSLLTADRTNVRLWDASGRLRTFLCDHGKPVHADLARYIAGRNEIITAGDKITFWSSEGEWLRELPLRGEGRALTPDERYLLVGGGETMQLLELATGSLRDLPASGNAFLDAKQERAAIISEDGLRIRLYDLASGTLDRELEEKGVKFGAVSWSPDGRYLVALHDLEHEQLPDPDGGATLWNVSSGKLVNHLIGHRGEITAAAFSPDGAYLASGDYRGMVFLWKGSDFETPEIDTFPEVRAKYLPGHGEMIRGLAFSDDSRRLVTRASEEPARVWDVRTQKLLAVLAGSEEKDILDARFSPNAIKVATRSNDGTVRIWHASTDLRSRVVEERFGAVAVSADRRRFAFVHKGDVRVFDENGRTVAAFSVPLATTSVLDLSADGSKLAVLAEEGAAVIDVATRKVMHPPVEHPYCTSVSVTSNGRYLLTMGGTVAAVWDLEKRTSKVLQAEVPHIAMRAVLSPDGKLVA